MNRKIEGKWIKNGENKRKIKKKFGKKQWKTKEKKKVLAVRRRFKEISKKFENPHEFFKELNLHGNKAERKAGERWKIK